MHNANDHKTMRMLPQVGPIVEQVRQEGDAAVRQFTERFDKVKLDDICVATQVSSRQHACMTQRPSCTKDMGLGLLGTSHSSASMQGA